MIREIKFRGNSLVTKEKVFGHLFYFDDGRYFISPKGTVVEGDEGEYPSEYYLRGVKCIEVEPETVSQYTGLKDKNGVEIYEGDIIRTYLSDIKGEARWGRIVMKNPFEYSVEEALYINYADELEILGNIYENPELLKEDTNEQIQG